MITTEHSPRLWHPWLRIQRLIRVILETRWDADERHLSFRSSYGEKKWPVMLGTPSQTYTDTR